MLTYFLQVNVCWLLFYGLYYALLSRETFFKLNRIYLIISLLCGLIIPTILSKIDTPIAQPLIEAVQPITVSFAEMQKAISFQTVETQTTTWDIWTILMKLYFMGVAFFLLKFCWGLLTIFKLYRGGQKERKAAFSLIYTEGVKTPFSFFNWVFVNQKTIENADYQQIILHEKAHVQQRHSLDIVGLEILRGLFWLSPLVHLYARSMRHVHEYLADAAVLQNTEKKQYGRLLVSQTVAGRSLILANHLNFSQLKKRIIMMSRNPSQRVALVKYTFAAPVFLLIVALLASPKTKILANTEGVSRGLEKVINSVATTVNNTPNSQNTVSESLNLDILSDSTRKPPFDVLKNPIPDPMPRFSGMAKGTINRENFIKQTMMSLIQPIYSHTVFCSIQSFQVFRTPFGKENYQVGNNTGDKLNENVLPIIQAAQNGDIYQFKNIKVRCPGDAVARNLDDLFFIIDDNPNAFVEPKLINDDKPFLCLAVNSGKSYTGGRIESNFLKVNSGLIFKNNEKKLFHVAQYHIYTISKTGVVSKEVLNIGPGIYGEAEALIQNAEIDDNVYFKNVLVRKSGETELQNWGTLQFTLIKNRDLVVQQKALYLNTIQDDIQKSFKTTKDCGMKEGDTGQMPVFQGGEKEIENFIYSHLRYPEASKKARQEGLFIISYIVSADGQVTDVHPWTYKWDDPRKSTSAQPMTLAGIQDQPLIDEAVRVVSSMPRWKPGTRNGVVACHIKQILIKFQIEK